MNLLINLYILLLISKIVTRIEICIKHINNSLKDLKVFETVMLEIIKSFTFRELDVLTLRHLNN